MDGWMDIYARTYTYIHIYTHTYIYTYYTYRHIHMHSHRYRYTLLYIHIYAYIHIHVCIHIHTHPQALTCIYTHIYTPSFCTGGWSFLLGITACRTSTDSCVPQQMWGGQSHRASAANLDWLNGGRPPSLPALGCQQRVLGLIAFKGGFNPLF